MTARNHSANFIVALFLLGACAPSRDQSGTPRDDTSQAASAQTPAGAMTSMPGSMESAPIMEAMRSHLSMMQNAPMDSLQTLLPTHRQMVANTIATFNGEMRGMNMSADAAWVATVDSLRSDLVRAPAMNSAELKAFLPGHSERITHLMQMHQKMMGAMKM